MEAFFTVLKAVPEVFRRFAEIPLDTSPLPNNNPGFDAGSMHLQVVLNIAFGTLGSIALLIIVISGLRYILAGGDPQKMSQAKNGIIYALVGLAIILSAFTIVTLVAKGLQ